MLGLQQIINRNRLVSRATPAGTSSAVAAAVPRSGVSNTNRQARFLVGLAAMNGYQASEGPLDHAAAQQQDPGLESFKAVIAERRFTCTQCGKCCTGVSRQHDPPDIATAVFSKLEYWYLWHWGEHHAYCAAVTALDGCHST
jgi:hypothetical protein